MKNIKQILYVISFFLIAHLANSQNNMLANKLTDSHLNDKPNENNFLFEENKNQLPQQVKYKAEIGSGTSMYLEKDRFTYVMSSLKETEKNHQENNKGSENKHFHSFQMKFSGSDPSVKINAENKSTHYSNYFIGNDPSKWSHLVYSFEKVRYSNLYNKIDLIAYEKNKTFKYDFEVGIGGNPTDIVLDFDGAEKIFVKDEKLIIKTTVGELIESAPFSYQIINGKKQEVPCFYHLSNNGKTVRFSLPKGYNKNYALIIDPAVINAATYSGCAANMKIFGYSAAYDSLGNIYSAGSCLDFGYPTTIGAFQQNLNVLVGALGQDVVINKFNPTGSNLIWATYLGGTDLDYPGSLFVHRNGEVYIHGQTKSNDFPCSANAYDNTFNGNEDIFVAHLNSMGTALIGSTFIGGTSSDGEDRRGGEIIVDSFGDVFVGSITASVDFPVTAGAYDQLLNGLDGCLFKLSANLSVLQFSTLFGGSNNDFIYGLRLNQAGDIFVTGATDSPDLPITANTYDQVHNGRLDAYIAKFNANGSALLSSTFFGTASDEMAYFIDLDNSSNVYVLGNSGGSMPVTPNVYSNTNAKSFISKFNSTLTTLQLSTVIGDSSFALNPVAFMVDSNKNIYAAGFEALGNYPVTADALFPNSAAVNGGSCYLLKLCSDASSLLFGSYYYGEHTDGGMSRFDKNGILYLTICMNMGLGATTPGAWKDNTNVPGLDLFTAKITFPNIKPKAIIATQKPTYCKGETIVFNNNSVGSIYSWDFGDGTPIDTTKSPSHTYSVIGIYTVSLIVKDPKSCLPDTAYLEIRFSDSPVSNFAITNACAGSASQFTNTSYINAPGTINNYQWNFGDGNINGNQTPTHTYTLLTISDTTYTVKLIVTSNNGCKDSASKQVTIYTLPTASFISDSVCLGNATQLMDASIGHALTNYEWDFLNNGTVDASGSAQINYTFPTFGVNLVSYTVSSAPEPGLTCKSSTVQNVWVHATPVADFIFLNRCINTQPNTFDASGSNIAIGTNTAYAWAYGNGATGTGINSSYTYTTASVYNVSLTVTSNKGCQSAISKQVEVYEKPYIHVSANRTCLGSATTFTANTLANSGNIIQWNWDVNNSINTIETSGRQSSYLYATEGSQTLAIITTTYHNCKDTLRRMLYVNYIPSPEFTVDDPDGCPLPYCAVFTDQTPLLTGPARIVNWQWNFGDNTTVNSGTNATQAHCYKNMTGSSNFPSFYTVGLTTTTDSGCVNSITKPSFITVYPKPIAQYIITPDAGNVTQPFIHFTNQSIDYTTWIWNFGDSPAPDSTNRHPDHFYESVDSKLYNSSLIVTNQYGCTDTAYVKVNIEPEFTFYIPNCFTPNADGVNDGFIGAGIGIVKHEMWIFDRWGEQVYYTDDICKPWDGSIKGKTNQSKQDVYVWKVRIKDIFERRHDYIGHVTLLK